MSRLYGHSSSSGANFISEEIDPLAELEKSLEARGVLTRAQMDALREKHTQYLLEASKRVRTRPQPKGRGDLRLHVFADGPNEASRKPAALTMATMVQAVRMALHVGESRMGVTDIFGEDVGAPLGGVFTATQGLKTAWNSPKARRARRRRRGDRASRSPGQKPVRGDPVLRLRLQHDRSAEARRGNALVVERAVGLPDGAHDPGGERHSRQASITRTRSTRRRRLAPGVEDRDAPSTPRDAYGPHALGASSTPTR